MSDLPTLEHSLDELRRAIVGLDAAEMDVVSNCAPWTVRRLASHALDNQLFWAGLVTGQEIVSHHDAMAANAHEGDLAAHATDVTARALALWQTAGVLEATHATPLGELPGSVVVNFPTIDAVAHAWDITASVGRAIEFPADRMAAIAAVVQATCTDAARGKGLIQPITMAPADATDTERLMTLAGRAIPR
jgi:uncharacterized protein (TIGR03086 family)